MIRSLGTLTAGVTTALALAGCVTATDPGTASPSRSAAVRPTATGAAVVAKAVPSESERNPERLRGLTPEAVTVLIGMPHYTRREGGATVWQYYAGGCVMDLFWYATSEGPRLFDYEVRGVRLTGTAEPRSCFGDLLVRRSDSATTS